ncbi:hypothetical protein BKA67DRAFT_692427 [Truncatella angustata]|uniref:DUF7689 domain-containing protein n=1 Tax=Truncatella angustata TaxID=152316 RepID=A0A9P8UJJ0_9PEZI|nr:uncharacterized protein BKA67DRAFT_692427 [Truncatella angustata]KAH6653188.1 hypothetical protein BKA67DRAFT_692427 [Truncatella angustata]
MPAPRPTKYPSSGSGRQPTAAEKALVEGEAPELKGKQWLVLIPSSDRNWVCWHWALDVLPKPIEFPPDWNVPPSGNSWLSDELWDDEKVLIQRGECSSFRRRTDMAKTEILQHPEAEVRFLRYIDRSVFCLPTSQYSVVQTNLTRVVTELGFTQTKNADEADVDCFYSSRTGRFEHFSRKVDGFWTCKLGSGPVIVHPRDVFDGGDYGTRKIFFKYGSGTAAVSSFSIADTVGTMASPAHNSLTSEDDELIQSFANLAKKPAPVPKAPIKNSTPPKAAPAKPTPAKPTPAKTTPAKTTPVKTTPAKPTPAKTTPAKPTPAKPTPAKPTPAPGTTKPTPPPAQDNKLKQDFDQNWKSFLVAMEKPTKYSNPKSVLQLPEWQKIKKQGQGVLPFLVDLLRTGKNTSALIVCIFDLDPKQAIKGTAEQKLIHIIKSNAAKTKQISAQMGAVSVQSNSLLQAGFEGAKLTAKLLNDPIFHQIVSEGIAAVPHILDAYSKDGKHGVELYTEMLKQIYEIHAKKTTPDAQKQEFEEWLEQYLQPQTDSEQHDESEPAADEVQEEAPEEASAPGAEEPTSEEAAANE